MKTSRFVTHHVAMFFMLGIAAGLVAGAVLAEQINLTFPLAIATGMMVGTFGWVIWLSGQRPIDAEG